MELSPSWKAASRSSTLELKKNSWKVPEGSLPCSQEPTTGPYPEPDQSCPYNTIINFNIILLWTQVPWRAIGNPQKSYHIPRLKTVYYRAPCGDFKNLILSPHCPQMRHPNSYFNPNAVTDLLRRKTPLQFFAHRCHQGDICEHLSPLPVTL
jgi:hypothetical protein